MKPFFVAPSYWFAIRTTYNRELKLQKLLTDKGIKSFIPLRYESFVENEVKKYMEKPAIHNLIFVNCDEETINKFRNETDFYFQYINECGTNKPAIISDEEMNEFIRITELTKESVIYLKDDIERFKKYSRIRVTGGRLEGIEGYFVRIKRDRKVVVLLKDITAIAISGIDLSLIELIDE